MADYSGSKQQNPSFDSLFAALDPVSLILSQQSCGISSDTANALKLIAAETDFVMERGPRYRAYAELRESRLRARKGLSFKEPTSRILTPRKAPVKIDHGSKKPSSYSALAQSVPDFSSMLRKENRKPPPQAQQVGMTSYSNRLPPKAEICTPSPSKNHNRIDGIMSKLRGSQSASAGEKKVSGLLARKSYASFEELKGFSSSVANAINGGGEGEPRRIEGDKKVGGLFARKSYASFGEFKGISSSVASINGGGELRRSTRVATSVSKTATGHDYRRL